MRWENDTENIICPSRRQQNWFSGHKSDGEICRFEAENIRHAALKSLAELKAGED